MTKMQRPSEAMNTLRKAFAEDPGYAWAWHCSIAMAMYDEFPDSFWVPNRSEQLKIANKAASKFMKNAFGIETHKNMMKNMMRK